MTKLGLRLTARLILVVCLLLFVAKVWGVRFNHSPILVYAASEYAQNPLQYPMFVVDVERNLFSRLWSQEVYSGMFPTCSLNGQVAFTSLKGATYVRPANIYVMDIFSERTLQVTRDLGSNSLPSWSPDGEHLAFVTTTSSSLYGDIYVVDLTGGAPQRIAQRVYPTDLPHWSPDGKSLLVAGALDRYVDVYAVTLKDYSLRRLTDNEAVEEGPVWSPDGELVAFASNQAGGFDIYVMDSDGGNQRRLAYTAGDDDFPVWSPDGKTLVFLDSERGQIHMIDKDGQNRRLLADGVPSFHAPVWSPDGQQLAVIREIAGQIDIYLVNTDGSGHRSLVHTGSSFVSVAWCP